MHTIHKDVLPDLVLTYNCIAIQYHIVTTQYCDTDTVSQVYYTSLDYVWLYTTV